MKRNIPQFLIAAPASGSGKTTVSRGVMALLVKKGLSVQPFKCGPDYIDTKYHTAVCGRPSMNLDTFMASGTHVRELYARHSADADVSVVEGMMGMFDGYDRDRGSSAEVAQLLGIPVVLVVDAKSAAYSMAPLLSGFINFRPEIHIAGVIFNRVGSPRHYAMLREVCDDLKITCFGYLPKQQELEQKSRHLGLDFSLSKETESLDLLASLLEEHVDWQLLLEQTSLPLSLPENQARMAAPHAVGEERQVCNSAECIGNLRIWVARNEESFSFLYEEHLDILHHLGTVTFFNPEQNLPIPQDIDLLYLPGGYPEERIKELGGAWRTKASIRNYIENGGKVLAECGGMIYLSQAIVDDACRDSLEKYDETELMVGVFPFLISNEKSCRRLALGYRQFEYNGQHLRGHEFHYTTFKEGQGDANFQVPPSVTQVYNAKGHPVHTPVFRYKNVIAGYTHLYWGEIDVMALF